MDQNSSNYLKCLHNQGYIIIKIMIIALIVKNIKSYINTFAISSRYLYKYLNFSIPSICLKLIKKIK